MEPALAALDYGQNSSVGKIREIHPGLPARIHVVLIRQRSDSERRGGERERDEAVRDAGGG
jgi:hypothetical protein